MLGDTSMGMINGYFGPRLLHTHGFTEHKVDQAWIIDRGRRIDEKRIDDALRVREGQGRRRSTGARAAPRTSTSDATREQLRGYLAVLDLLDEFKADCLGWQYQLGLIPLRPPSDFAEGLFNSTCRPESNGDTIACAHRGRPGQPRADGADEAAAQGEGAAPGGDVPRRALGRRARGPLPLGAAQLRLVRRLRLQPRSRHAARACTATASRRSISRCRAARSPARACPAR